MPFFLKKYTPYILLKYSVWYFRCPPIMYPTWFGPTWVEYPLREYSTPCILLYTRVTLRRHISLFPFLKSPLFYNAADVFQFLNKNFLWKSNVLSSSTRIAGGFTLSDFLDKPWSQRCRPFSPPVRAFIFIAHVGFSIPTARRFSWNVADSRSRALH